MRLLQPRCFMLNCARLACSGPSSLSSSVQVYTNPISKLVVGAKLFSLSSSGVTLAAQPFIISKFASFATFAPFFVSSLAFALLTPILLHVLTRSCVFSITYDKNKSKFTAYTKSIFLQSKSIEFDERDVSYSVASLSFANMTVRSMVRLTLVLNLSQAFKGVGFRVQLKNKARASGHTLKPFVDSKYVVVHAGKGGDGCIAFDRLFCNPNGGPSGGDGGNGGHIIFEADPTIHDLSHISSILKAPDGCKGSGSNRHGASANHLIVAVPLQTQIFSVSPKADVKEDMNLLKVLSTPSETMIAARGGVGGRGNAFFACANQAHYSNVHWRAREATLRLAERGSVGETRRLLLQLMSFADIGFVGFPNAGKSSLLRRLTRARPRVAPYPFTTIQPHVGTLEIPPQNGEGTLKLTIADLPGIIEGAATHNAGLGACFLSFIERCRAIVYLIDVSTVLNIGGDKSQSVSSSDATSEFAQQLGTLHRELQLFNPHLVDPSRLSLVIGTKIDLVVPPSGGSESLGKISQCLIEAAQRVGLKSSQILLISSLRGDCINELVEVLSNKLIKRG
nr:GTP binding protein 5 [Hymenolepis microstoma]